MSGPQLQPLPTVVLAGSDRRPVVLPETGRDKHPLTGYKGADVRIGGKPMIELLVERLEASPAIGEVFIAGPAQAYRFLDQRARLVDTDGTFGENIRHGLEAARARYNGSVAFITCDVLPTAADLQRLLEQYVRCCPCDLWCPLVRAPEDPERLGASAWKPAYRIVLRPGEPPLRILPGHLVVADPAALRLNFIYRLFQLGYQTRNRSISYRRAVMVRGLLAGLLFEDLRHVFGLRVPNLTWTVLGAGIPTARKLKEGRASQALLEETLRRIFVTYRHRRRHPERRIHLPIVDELSLALDVDTEEEARQLGKTLGNAGS